MSENLHHFISYSQAEATEFAMKLHDNLTSGGLDIWLDKRDMQPMISWDVQLEKAIDKCRTLLFIMTPDSVENQSGCTFEWKRALRLQKPIIPILRVKKTDPPFLLEGRQHIDFSDDQKFDASLAKLRLMLNWLESPEGYLHSLDEHLGHLRRLSRRVQDAELAEVNEEIRETEQKIYSLKYPSANIPSKDSSNLESSNTQSKSIENQIEDLNTSIRDNSKPSKIGVKTSEECEEEFFRRSFFGIPPIESQYKSDVFMIMPFTESLKYVYSDHIVRVTEKYNLTIKRGDDFFSRNSIIVDIWGALNSTKIVIADCTGRNPNVFYELGIAHTLGKPTILISQSVEDIPFDLRHLRFIAYSYTPAGMAEFENRLGLAFIQIFNKPQ